MPIDRRARRQSQADRAEDAAARAAARLARIEAAEERLEFLDVCCDLLEAIEQHNERLSLSAVDDGAGAGVEH
jgi:hypothetical protein